MYTLFINRKKQELYTIIVNVNSINDRYKISEWIYNKRV